LKLQTKIIIGIFSFLLMFSADATGLLGDVLQIKGLEKQSVDIENQTDLRNQFKSSVSTQNLLGLSRSGKSLLPEISLSASAITNLKMCAVRVQFAEELTDDPNTTGNGHYDFRTYEQFFDEEHHGVDPAPHNREYFEKHIEALNNYWNTISNGRLTIDATVFPLVSDSVYTLEKSLGYYGEQEPANGLGEFFYEALQAADMDTAIHWSQFDVFVVFHAGSDQQNNMTFSPTNTPSDLYTGFITMQWPGVPVLDLEDTVWLLEGMMMPETASQDNRATALNAVMAHEFGHQLGLIDIYDTHTFTTYVGDFSLMDNNGFGTGVDLGFELTRTILGTIPVYPDAWSRAYLGFVDVIEIEEGINFDVHAAELASFGTKIYKVPISENEYFLIENRQVDPDRDGGASLKADLGNTGVILGPAPDPSMVPPGQPAPLTREYDFLMPGSGIVIWHIDESVAWMDYDGDGLNNFYDNDLNWFYIPQIDSAFEEWEDRPFIRLVEADGIIDFGGEYWTNYGRPEDFYQASGNNHFGPYTNPSTRSNSDAHSGIDVFDITGIDTIMYFDLTQDLRMPGWPHHTDSSKFAPVLYDIDRDGFDEVFISGKNYILGFAPDGGFIFPPKEGFETISERRSVPRGPLAEQIYIDTLRIIASIGSQEISTPPTIADLNGDGIAEMAVGTKAGGIYIYSLQDENDNGLADPNKYLNPAGMPFNTPFVVSDVTDDYDGLELIAGDSAGGLYIISSEGDLISQTIGFNEILQFSVSPSYDNAFVLNRLNTGSRGNYFVHDLNDPSRFISVTGEVIGFSAGYIGSTDTIGIVVVTQEGKMFTYQVDEFSFGSSFIEDTIDIDQPVVSRPVLFPGFPEYGRSQMFFAGENMLYVYNLNGTPADYFPREVDIHSPSGPISSTPIIADVTGDGEPEIILGTSAGEIFFVSDDGTQISTSPVAAPDAISTSTAFCPNSEQGGNQGCLYTVTDDGLIYGFTLPSIETNGYNYYYQADGGSHHRNFQDIMTTFSDTGDGLMVYSYNYPNPASEMTNIRFELTDDAVAIIKIYDLSGRLVYEDDNIQAVGGMANEYRWSLEDFPSGVYHCRLEVKGNDASEVQFMNIAVVK
jgi:M6 family metalloprotease-like protein